MRLANLPTNINMYKRLAWYTELPMQYYITGCSDTCRTLIAGM